MTSRQIPPRYRNTITGEYPVPAWKDPDPSTHVEVLLDDSPEVPDGYIAILADEPDSDNILRYTVRLMTEEELASRNPVPEEITRLQARLALIEAGMWDAVMAFSQTADAKTQAFFEDAQVWRRDNSILCSATEAMKIDEAKLDGLFRMASEL